MKKNAGFRVAGLSLIMSATFASLACPAMAGQEGKGGDKVEPLFIIAQKEAVRVLNLIGLNEIDQLNIPSAYKNWLKEPNRLSRLQFFASAMRLSFQGAPCIEGASPRGTSFDNSDPNAPQMCVSYSYNQNTTLAQAEILVIHEAGHFTGEMNHLFLSELGTELVEHPLTPQKVTLIKISNQIWNPNGTSTLFNPVFTPAGYGPAEIAASGGGSLANMDGAHGTCRAAGFNKAVGYDTHRTETVSHESGGMTYFNLRNTIVCLTQDGSFDKYTRNSNFERVLASVTCEGKAP